MSLPLFFAVILAAYLAQAGLQWWLVKAYWPRHPKGRNGVLQDALLSSLPFLIVLPGTVMALRVTGGSTMVMVLLLLGIMAVGIGLSSLSVFRNARNRLMKIRIA